MRKKVFCTLLAGVLILSGCGTTLTTADSQQQTSDSEVEIESEDTAEMESESQTEMEDSEAAETEASEESALTESSEISEISEIEISWTNSGLVYWVTTREWGEAKDLTAISFYSDGLTLPLELNQFDALVSTWLCLENYYNSMDELMADSSITIDPEEMTVIREQTGVESIEEIRVENHSDESLSVGECYENGWWYLYNELDIDDMFFLDEPDGGWTGDDLIDAVVDYAGAPSYILTQSRYLDKLQSDEEGTTVSYNLVYEYDDFVLCIFAYEKLASSDDHETEVCYAYYYPTEEWEMIELTSYKVTQIADVNGVELRLYTK